MATGLKRQNLAALTAMLLANVAIFGVLLATNALMFPSLSADWKSYLKPALPAGIAIIVCGILNELFSANAKARVVFWRWRYPLPGSAAFTRYAPEDPRIDMAALKARLGPLPTDPKVQNAAWYSLYKKVTDEPSVNEAHRSYLFNRDYASLALLLLITLGPVAIWRVHPAPPALVYVVFLAAQYLVVRRAAATTGIAFVTNVIASQPNAAPGTPAHR